MLEVKKMSVEEFRLGKGNKQTQQTSSSFEGEKRKERRRLKWKRSV